MSPDPDTGAETDGEVLDRTVLDGLEALESFSGGELLAPIVAIFGRDGGQSLAAIRSGYELDESARLLSALHKLRGSAGNVGARRVAALCQQLETVAAAGDHRGWEGGYDRLASELEWAKQALAEVLADRDQPGPSQPGPSQPGPSQPGG